VKRPQWIVASLAFLLVVILFATTQKTMFGEKKRIAASSTSSPSITTVTVDSILFHAKENLSPAQVSRLTELENGISRGDVQAQKLHSLHQLAAFWKDTGQAFEPFAWYTAEAARLENSEKSLTFAARLFLEGLKNESRPDVKQWEAVQAKDLFERSLKLNPANDSAKVYLGSVYLYGGLGSPMEGIGMVREVASRDSNNIHAQITLGEASLVSGQLDKAIERYKTVVRIQPDNLEAIFRIAETYEQMKKNAESVEWYRKSLPLIKNPEIKKEVEKRIDQLKK
jgi:tetratricopeptide (TPR) repeat protein